MFSLFILPSLGHNLLPSPTTTATTTVTTTTTPRQASRPLTCLKNLNRERERESEGDRRWISTAIESTYHRLTGGRRGENTLASLDGRREGGGRALWRAPEKVSMCRIQVRWPWMWERCRVILNMCHTVARDRSRVLSILYWYLQKVFCHFYSVENNISDIVPRFRWVKGNIWGYDDHIGADY